MRGVFPRMMYPILPPRVLLFILLVLHFFPSLLHMQAGIYRIDLQLVDAVVCCERDCPMHDGLDGITFLASSIQRVFDIHRKILVYRFR